MFRLLTVLMLFVVLNVSYVAADDAEDLGKMKGTWDVVEFVIGRKADSKDDSKYTFVIDGETTARAGVQVVKYSDVKWNRYGNRSCCEVACPMRFGCETSRQ